MLSKQSKRINFIAVKNISKRLIHGLNEINLVKISDRLPRFENIYGNYGWMVLRSLPDAIVWVILAVGVTSESFPR